MKRFSVRVRGAVQGVGFRPFVYRLANKLSLRGWVVNNPSGVEIEIEGPVGKLESFLENLRDEKPRMALIQSLEHTVLEPTGYHGFEIRESSEDEEKTVLVLPDIGTCGECLEEVSGDEERRFRYPFTNCTNCGPRYTIIEKLPYDRPSTTMKSFAMCPDCKREYETPEDRRFHAQPIACPVCGPRIFLTHKDGERISDTEGALEETIQHIMNGKIVAMKGLGGFLLLCDARSGEAVGRLRTKKYREEKPFALMYPDIGIIKADCEVHPFEEELLKAPQHPIVLLRKKEEMRIAENVAPSNPYLGVMLPYSPLHHLLLNDLDFPVVATSGNKTDDPIAIDNEEALQRLGSIADYFLMHDRPILRRVDDSVVRVIDDRMMILRRARGYAPLPVHWQNPKSLSVLAFGGHLKNTVSFSKGDNIFSSQHIGDLETYEAIESFKEGLSSLEDLYEFEPDMIASDLHPRYISSKVAQEMALEKGLEIERVQHHHAHVASCMCENDLKGTVLGVSWDGVGYGTDAEAWGSEFLIADFKGFERHAHFMPFPLPGGEAKVRDVSHSALGMLYTVFKDDICSQAFKKLPSLKSFEDEELDVLANCMKSGFNSPMVYGIGRVFDAISSIIGIRQRCSFEAQAAMELEFAGSMTVKSPGSSYPYSMQSEKPIVVDWRPMVRAIVEDHLDNVDRSMISLRFHQTLAGIILDIAQGAGHEDVVLTGGVFQNALLTSLARKSLEGNKFNVHAHSLIPPNDGGISVGQVAVALERNR
jgi:hydrogenase maturation protein HypF